MRKTTIVLRTLVAALALISSACGGSVSPTDPTPVPTPAPVPGPQGTPWSELPPLSEEAKDYIIRGNLNSVYQGGEPGTLKRWPSGPIPYFHDEGYDAGRVAAAANFLRTTLDGIVDYQQAPSMSLAKLSMFWKWPPPLPISDNACAGGRPDKVERSVVLSGWVYFDPARPACVSVATIAHEMLHAWGLAEHTSTGVLSASNPTLDMPQVIREVVRWISVVPAATRPI